MAEGGAGPRGINLLIWMIVFTVLCIIFLTLRFWAAILSKRRLYLDDGFVLFAFANTFALEGVGVWAIYNGLGKHTNELAAHEYGVQFKLIVASNVTWLLGTVFIKFAILWFYTRIFSVRQFKRWSYAAAGLVCCYFIAFIILFMSRCRPVSQQWDPQPEGWCRDIYIDQLTSVSFNLLIDIIIIALPFPILWSLQLPLRAKIAATAMFSIGLITIGIMAWRLQFTVATNGDPDFVYNLYSIGLISLLELWLGVIVACIPTLAPLYKAYIKPAFTKVSHQSRSERSQVQLQKLSAIGSGAASLHGSRLPRQETYRQLGDDFS